MLTFFSFTEYLGTVDPTPGIMGWKSISLYALATLF